MACFKPLEAWKLDDGRVVFTDRGAGRPLQLPCGQCVGCRLERSRQWAMRCMHEAQCHQANSFITLTYNDEHLQTSLDYRDFQLFMKRLRKKYFNVRFYMAGEYGEQFFRPHFHACLFGVDFSADRKLWRQLDSGSNLYTSSELEALWPFGFSSVGDVTFESAAYVARYVMKKVTGDRADEHYQRVDIRTGELLQVTPEFNRMSLKPGIGRPWVEKFGKEVVVNGGVVVNGQVSRNPKYYDSVLAEKFSKLYSDLEFERYVASQKSADDCTPERLEVRRQVTEARLNFKKRVLE